MKELREEIVKELRREWKREQKSYVLVVNVLARTTLVFPFVFFQKRKSRKEERAKRRMCVSESLTPIYYHHSICARIMHSTCQSEHKSKMWRETTTKEWEREYGSEGERREYGSEERESEHAFLKQHIEHKSTMTRSACFRRMNVEVNVCREGERIG